MGFESGLHKSINAALDKWSIRTGIKLSEGDWKEQKRKQDKRPEKIAPVKQKREKLVEPGIPMRKRLTKEEQIAMKSKRDAGYQAAYRERKRKRHATANIPNGLN